jgi:hypothetical protein
LQAFSGAALVPAAQPIPYTPVAPNAEADPLGWKRSERLAIKSHLTMYVEVSLLTSVAMDGV